MSDFAADVLPELPEPVLRPIETLRADLVVVLGELCTSGAIETAFAGQVLFQVYDDGPRLATAVLGLRFLQRSLAPAPEAPPTTATQPLAPVEMRLIDGAYSEPATTPVAEAAVEPVASVVAPAAPDAPRTLAAEPAAVVSPAAAPEVAASLLNTNTDRFLKTLLKDRVVPRGLTQATAAQFIEKLMGEVYPALRRDRSSTTAQKVRARINEVLLYVAGRTDQEIKTELSASSAWALQQNRSAIPALFHSRGYPPERLWAMLTVFSAGKEWTPATVPGWLATTAAETPEPELAETPESPAEPAEADPRPEITEILLPAPEPKPEPAPKPVLAPAAKAVSPPSAVATVDQKRRPAVPEAPLEKSDLRQTLDRLTRGTVLHRDNARLEWLEAYLTGQPYGNAYADQGFRMAIQTMRGLIDDAREKVRVQSRFGTVDRKTVLTPSEDNLLSCLLGNPKNGITMQDFQALLAKRQAHHPDFQAPALQAEVLAALQKVTALRR